MHFFGCGAIAGVTRILNEGCQPKPRVLFNSHNEDDRAIPASEAVLSRTTLWGAEKRVSLSGKLAKTDDGRQLLLISYANSIKGNLT